MKRKAAETLAEWRARRALEFDKGLDPILSEADGRRLTALVAKNPALLPRLMDLADRFRGGGARLEHTGRDGGPVEVVLAEEARRKLEALFPMVDEAGSKKGGKRARKRPPVSDRPI